MARRPSSAWPDSIGFTLTAALVEANQPVLRPNWSPSSNTHRPTDWEPSGLASVYLAQNTYHAGPIVSVPVDDLVLVDPLVSIIVSVTLLGLDLRSSAAFGPLEAFSLLVLLTGTFRSSNPRSSEGSRGCRRRGHRTPRADTAPRPRPSSPLAPIARALVRFPDPATLRRSDMREHPWNCAAV